MNPLGQETQYPQQYDPSLLFPIARSENRKKQGIGDTLPFRGYDVWRCYELSWLTPSGKPVQATGELIVPADSPNMVESKSLKLYLNSLNQHRIIDIADAQQLIAQELSAITQSRVLVQLDYLDSGDALQLSKPTGSCLDQLDVVIEDYLPKPALLKVDQSRQVEESVYSHLFRSNCPVTQQPDWGSIQISYQGAAIAHDSLLRYLVSFRQHEGFHEDCAEQIYMDIQKHCAPQQLMVAINFLRRGGIEINPVRGNTLAQIEFPAPRLARQ
ncbi:MAG: NADPH-dependent 7-cyano-7-deazaguanine reductase QueF [Pseudohongiellaceae bacterium]|nr:NADPH-dependent 7-cyano-7-deazaguanine reductase QueF [Pseudohongiellaceae bacterium]